MSKLNQATEAQFKANIDYIDRRWKGLHEMEVKRGDAALNYLFLVSGGAAAATLTYIGNLTKDGTSVPTSAFWMLGLFSLAVILVGLLKIWATYKIVWIFRGWRSIVQRYYGNEIGWREGLQEDDTNVKRCEWVIHLLVWLAYFSIAGGVAVGFFKLQEESSRVRTEKAVSAAAPSGPKAAGTSPSDGGPRTDQNPDERRLRAEQPATAADAHKKEVKKGQ